MDNLRTKKMRRSGPFAIVVLLCAFFLSACHKEAVAPLKDPAKLRSDAVKMLEDAVPVGDVPKSQWPASIKALKPISVMKELDNIKILLAHEQGRYSVGYHIYRDADRKPSTQGVWVEKTAFEGIYIYKTQY